MISPFRWVIDPSDYERVKRSPTSTYLKVEKGVAPLLKDVGPILWAAKLELRVLLLEGSMLLEVCLR